MSREALEKFRKAITRNKEQGDKPFLLSDWRLYSIMKSRVWAYNYQTKMVRTFTDRTSAESWDTDIRVFEYRSEVNVEQVLRGMS